MDKKSLLTSEQEKHMEDLQKLRIIREFNRRLGERTEILKRNTMSHA